MANFSKLISIRKFSKQTINIQQLVCLIKDNPHKEHLLRLRAAAYGSDEYSRLKARCECITPHGVFSGLKNSDLLSMSGYLFFDVDNIDNIDEQIEIIKKLNPTLICVSPSNRGLHILFRVSGMTKDNFLVVYKFVSNIINECGVVTDTGAGGLVRKMNISYDTDVFFDPNAEFIIDENAFRLFKVSFSRLKVTNLNTDKQIKGLNISNISAAEEEGNITLNGTFFKTPLSIKELLSEIRMGTAYTEDIDGDFVIDEQETYRILIPHTINDGTKHRLYTRIVNALYWLNPGVTDHQVYSYIYWVNQRAQPPMNDYRLRQYLSFLINNIKENGIMLKPRIKKIHFNKMSNLTTKQKQIMASKINGAMRTNKTIDLIQDTIVECARLGMKPTQKNVSDISGLSLRTVKRNWLKEKTDTSSMKIDVPTVVEPKLDTLSEQDFFGEG